MSELEYPITDEMLSAFLDGELDRPTADALRRQLANDEVLRARLERFQSADALIRSAFDPIADEPVPQSLMAAATRPARRRAVLRLPRLAVSHEWALPLAASVALAFGVALGSGLTLGTGSGADGGVLDRAVASGTPLHVALESTPSDDVYRAPSGDDVIAPVLTFKAADGRYCRQFEWRTSARTLVGVACRTDRGIWTPVAAVNVAHQAEDGGYHPAAGEEGDALSAIRTRMMTGAALDIEAEQKLIAHGWSGNPKP